jgi:CRISPR-associated protein Csa2
MISLAFRAVLNLESLNGVESVGNLTRHRTAPIVIPNKDGGYTSRYVPVLSGESLAHGYQSILVNVANNMKLPVGTLAKRGEFIKYAEKGYLGVDHIKAPNNVDDCRRFETDVLLKDIVSDVGGFFYAANPAVKRTSCIQFGYMLPAIDSIESASLETQFHARHIPSETKNVEMGQMPYNIEVGSALYTTTINLDLNSISELSVKYGNEYEDKKNELLNQKKNRKKAAISALMQLLSGVGFGAHKSRFFPNVQFVSAIAAISDPYTFVVSSGNSTDYINSTKSRAEQFKKVVNDTNSSKVMNIDLIAVGNDIKNDTELDIANNMEELMSKVLSKTKLSNPPTKK